MELTVFDRLYFVKSNIFIKKDLCSFFSFSSLKIKQLIIHGLPQSAGLPLSVSSVLSYQTADCPRRRFLHLQSQSRWSSGMSELQKGKIHSQEHYFLFQVTQYLKDKTIEGCGGRSGGRMSIGTSLVIFEGGIFSLLLL